MNKSELASAVAEKTGLTAVKSAEVINAVIETITAEMVGGNKVTLQGFGAFVLKERAARTSRNPKTGEAVQVPAKKVAKFTPGTGLKFS